MTQLILFLNIFLALYNFWAATDRFKRGSDLMGFIYLAFSAAFIFLIFPS